MSDVSETDQAGPDQSQKPDDSATSPKGPEVGDTTQDSPLVSKTNADLVEIGDQLTNMTYDPVLERIAETNNVTIPWSDLKEIIKSTVVNVLFVTSTWHEYSENPPKTNGTQNDHALLSNTNVFAARALQNGAELVPISFESSSSAEDTLDQGEEREASACMSSKETAETDNETHETQEPNLSEESAEDDLMVETDTLSTDREGQETDITVNHTKTKSTPGTATQNSTDDKEDNAATKEEIVGKQEKAVSQSKDAPSEPMEVD
ncbi:hypothetical protein EC973_003339 [Apophysomyces ossiformis]|uniref:Uncharacterized protein n=1 Tax=Apophysomyces ossiformis TaxID=679940 RepID=A0A8H7BZB8_9FUNG|nr:hypothetical protein EC973_003339 [Apophysomyces ossiformis]